LYMFPSRHVSAHQCLFLASWAGIRANYVQGGVAAVEAG